MKYYLNGRGRVCEIRRICQTCPAKFENVQRRAIVQCNQMSGEKQEMSGEAQNNFKYSGRGNALGLVYVSVCVGFFESYVVQHLNGARLDCACVYYNSMFLGANLTLGTKTAVTSLIMVRFDCFHLPVVAKYLGHSLHPQLMAHMCVCANEFHANLRARVRQSMSLGAQWEKYTLKIIFVRVRLGTPLPVS